MTSSIRSLLLGGAAILGASVLAAGSAHAQTDNFNGGGSTLAGKVYISAGGVYAGGTPNFNLTYGLSGSGNGYSAFLMNSLTLDYSGLTPPSGGVQFGASDAYATSAQISALNTALGVPMIQIPMFATPVTIAFNLPGFTTDGSLKLTDADLLNIFSGAVTKWNDPSLSANSPTVTLPNLAITVVYRSDSSGTSNIFTTHLANVAYNAPYNSNTGTYNNAKFGLGAGYPQNTANAVVPTLPLTGGNTFISAFASKPSNFLAATGSGGVQSAITSTSGAVGYLSPDYTDIAPINNGSTGFPPVASVNGVLPSAANVALALGTATAPSTSAQIANQQNFAPLVPLPASGYPISGYTYWFISQCYSSTSPAQGSDLKAFLGTYYTNGTYSSLISLNGFSPVASNLKTAIVNNLLKNNNSYNLDVQDATVCTSGVGRGS